MYYIGVDLGTSAVKLILMDKEGNVVKTVSREYPLYFPKPGWSEQNPSDWYENAVEGIKELTDGVDAAQVAGISFGGQMHGLVILDKDNEVIRPAILWNDGRTTKECDYLNNTIGKDKIAEYTANIAFAGFTAPKILWLRENEPENFKKIYKWLDIKEYLILRASGEFVMTQDSAFGTLLYDTRKGHEGWCKPVCDMVGVKMEHLAPIKKSTEKVGEVTESAAKELGLAPGTAVYGGGGDASLIGVGAGATEVGDTHIYSGTSGWVGTVVEKQTVDTGAMIAAIVGADPDTFNYFAELETSNKCVGWVKDHLALDEIGVFLKKYGNAADSLEQTEFNLYDYLEEVIDTVPAGSNGVVFTPWLHGNRCPFEDPNAAGMFFNIRLETGKTELIRSVVEGICFHMKWMYERQGLKVKTSDAVRFCGGGALGETTCQILSDILEKDVVVVESPQNIGAVGAAACIAVGMGLVNSMKDVKKLIPVKTTYHPNTANRAAYERNFKVFKNLYKCNKQNFAILNGQE